MKKKKEEKRMMTSQCCDKKQCTNILCVQNHMLVGFINDVFAHDREEVINAKDFLEVQARMWKHVRSFYTKDGKLKKKYNGGIIK
jgi:hypothetical protein